MLYYAYRIEIGDAVTSFDIDLFYGFDKLRSVVIPGTVERIDGNAFLVCSNLESVTIGSGVRFIDYDAFNGCTSTTNVYCYASPS